MKKKKILLLSDDMRLPSGVGGVSKHTVLGTLKEFDWVQIGGSIKHPDEGKVIDMCEDVRQTTGVQDAYVKIYPVTGYGNPEILRQIIAIEKPDAILHFTDPRFWGWLYQMEHEIRQQIPLLYLTIWDDLPYPRWNEPFYESCDLLMCISKQTHNIVRNVVRKYPKEDWQITYVPHGIDDNIFFPINSEHPSYGKLLTFKEKLYKESDPKFVLFWNNRNIRRKSPGDIILAYKKFAESIPEEDRNNILLLMHSDKVDQNGTDLPAVVEELCPYPVMFTDGKYSDEEMNLLYNSVDVTINLASNEGFGLSAAESLMSGVPIINNITGGLQDQCGFVDESGELVTEKHFNTDWGSNHDGRYQNCGIWAKPVFPASRSLQGSPPTPYIFDDRACWIDTADKIKEWYDMSIHDRKEAGLAGREYVMDPKVGMSAREMCTRVVKDINRTFEKWEPRKRFTLYKV
jgi:glycosyltransferase involved in cell wall biosynthesis